MKNSKFNKVFKKVGMMGVVFAAVFLAVWAVMPASGAGGSINSKFKV